MITMLLWVCVCMFIVYTVKLRRDIYKLHCENDDLNDEIEELHSKFL